MGRICIGTQLIHLDAFWYALAHFFGEGNGTPLQHSCLENPMDGGHWWAAVHGVAKSRTRLSNFTFTFHFHALEKEMATYSSVLAWRIPGTGEPGGLLSMGSHRVGHDWRDLVVVVVVKFMETYILILYSPFLLVQAYFILWHVILLCFADIAFFTNWSFVAALTEQFY